MNVEPIEVRAPDGIVLRGQYWHSSETWALLFHDEGTDLDCWQALVQPLLGRGYSICTLDLRGHGASEGTWDPALLGGDLDAAVAFAHAHGAKRIAFVGARESSLPALQSAYARHFFVIVALSPGKLGTLRAEELRGEGVPKLFIVGAHDESAVATARQLRDRAIGWTLIMRLPTPDQGTALLFAPWDRQVQEHIVAFLEEQRFRSPGQAAPDWSPNAADVLFKRMLGQ